MNLFEEIAIRISWIGWALDPRMRPGLCPPECGEGHSYQWPCRARIKKPKQSPVGAWRDKDVPHDPLYDESRIEG